MQSGVGEAVRKRVICCTFHGQHRHVKLAHLAFLAVTSAGDTMTVRLPLRALIVIDHVARLWLLIPTKNVWLSVWKTGSVFWYQRCQHRLIFRLRLERRLIYAETKLYLTINHKYIHKYTEWKELKIRSVLGLILWNCALSSLQKVSCKIFMISDIC